MSNNLIVVKFLSPLMVLFHSSNILYASFLLPQHNTKVEQIIENGNSCPQPKEIHDENGSLPETQDSDAVSEGFGAVSVYDQWVAPPVSGPRPKARYEVVQVTKFYNLYILILSLMC